MKNLKVVVFDCDGVLVDSEPLHFAALRDALMPEAIAIDLEEYACEYQAYDDYRRTQFGGWPWSSPSPVHARTDGRFAVHADGRVEHREMQNV